MKIVRPSRARAALALALVCAIAALALSLRSTPVPFLGFALAAVASAVLPCLEWPAPPASWRSALPRVHGLVLLSVALVAWFSRSLAVMDVPASTLASLGGAFVVPIAIVFAIAPRTFPAGRTLGPSIVYLLALAGLDPAPAGYGHSLLPFLRGTEHTAFAELYLALAALVLAGLWTWAFSESGPRWRARDVAGQAVAAVIALALAVTGVVGLPLLQPHVERALVDALDQGQTGLSGESTLGEFAELAVSRRRILDLQASAVGEPSAVGEASVVDDGPSATPPASDGPWRLRSEVFTAFDGRRWTLPPARPPERGGRSLPPASALDGGPLLEELGAWFRVVPRAPADAARAEALVAIRITQHETGRWPLLLPQRVLAVTVEADSLLLDGYGSVRRPGGIPVQLYGAIVPATPRGSATEPRVVEPAPLVERAENLALPPALDPRVRALALRLAPETATPRERLAATVAHLQAGYAYTLRTGKLGPDPLAEFLFDKKAGYCEYFATAAVVLLRLQGVPARYVKGLSLGPQTDQGGGLHVVRESDAHAWVEAWLPGEGWVEADPTPPGSLAGRVGASRLERLVQRARAAVALAWARVVTRGPLASIRVLGRALARLVRRLAREPLAWVTLASVLAGPRLYTFWRSRRRRRRAVLFDDAAPAPAELRALVREVERGWRRLGRPRPAARGLLEHARAVRASAETGRPGAAALAAACLEIVEAYYGARYGGELSGLPELRRRTSRSLSTLGGFARWRAKPAAAARSRSSGSA